GAHRLTVWARGLASATSEVRMGTRDMEQGMRLQPAPPIRGIVVDGDGRAVTLAHVVACAGKEQEEALSDESGRFELPPLPAGCAASGARPLTAGCSIGAYHPRFAASTRVRARAAVEARIELEPGGAIEGVATDARGRRIASFSVTLTSFDPAPGELADVELG